MLKNYFKISLRNIKRHKIYSIINIVGLAVEMTVFLLISFYVLNELSYDRFHKDTGSIYLVLRGENDFLMAPTSKLLAPALKTELPEVINSTCFSKVPGTEKLLVRYGAKHFEEDISLTDSDFFKIFSFSFKEGNPDKAFEGPNSLLLTETAAKKYFGSRSPLGETVQVYMFGRKVDMKVTGVLEDLPSNTHFYSDMFIHYDLVRSLGLDWDRWDNQILKSYILVQDGSDIHSLSNKIREIEIKYHKSAGLEKLTYDLLSVTKIHLYSSNIKFLSATGDIKYIYIFSVAAFIILLIAGINYMNLSTAFSLKRTKEVGVRKVVGASRSSLVRQFLGETVVLTFVSLILAVFLAQFFLPAFNQVSGKSLSLLNFSPVFVLGVLLIVLIISIFSGFYPALFLSAFKPVALMKIKSTPKMKGVLIRKGLLLFQFSLSIILIISTLVVYNQLFFVRNT
ncbi:MAG TPA: ABC transporter permease, partial [bacterium]|nr:ABC transporter permease [bacterium]